MSTAQSPRTTSSMRTSPLRTSPVRRSLSPVRRSPSPVRTSPTSSLSKKDTETIIRATATIADDKFIEMCNSSETMKKACNSGELEERKNSILIKRKSGASPYKSSVATGFLKKGDKKSLQSYAATLDKDGFRSLIHTKSLEKVIREDPFLAIRADNVEEEERKSMASTRASPMRASSGSRSPSPVRRSLSPTRASPVRRSLSPTRASPVRASPVRRSLSPTRASSMRKTPIDELRLSGNVREDAALLSPYTNAELRPYLQDPYVSKVVNSEVFTKEKSMKSSSPMKSSSSMKPAMSRLSTPVVQAIACRSWVSESSSDEESEEVMPRYSMARSNK